MDTISNKWWRILLKSTKTNKEYPIEKLKKAQRDALAVKLREMLIPTAHQYERDYDNVTKEVLRENCRHILSCLLTSVKLEVSVYNMEFSFIVVHCVGQRYWSVRLCDGDFFEWQRQMFSWKISCAFRIRLCMVHEYTGVSGTKYSTSHLFFRKMLFSVSECMRISRTLLVRMIYLKS